MKHITAKQQACTCDVVSYESMYYNYIARVSKIRLSTDYDVSMILYNTLTYKYTTSLYSTRNVQTNKKLNIY